ncbi:trypsin-like serine protease [uncultured Shewanella sp.]|uniref:trypsin-like serine peptidase n=1 Tax=uncultured Shewanella sp. TaxID=173975 RepID=UPI0026232A83|nr:trypsin-like serine protease [uncultured Shewanella sp.]
MIIEKISIKISNPYILFISTCYIFTHLFPHQSLSAKPKETHIFSQASHVLKEPAIFIDNMKMENSPYAHSISMVDKQVTYTDQELSNALTAIAVSKNGKQFSSKMSIEQLKQFSPAIAVEPYFDGYNEAALDPLKHYAETLNIEDAIKPMVVLGQDNRKQVTNTTVSSPYWHIGKLDIGCTGTLIAQNVVLTAGHCISDGNGFWYNNLDFSVAQNGTYLPWKKCTWETAVTTEAWHYYSDSNFDYGIIILDCIANGGWLGFGPFVSGVHSISGYASEKPYATMWTDEGPVTSTSHRLCYQIDTSNGVSGSAIVDSQLYIRGVHTTGSSSRNCGTKITHEVYSTLHYWMALYQ